MRIKILLGLSFFALVLGWLADTINKPRHYEAASNIALMNLRETDDLPLITDAEPAPVATAQSGGYYDEFFNRFTEKEARDAVKGLIEGNLIYKTEAAANDASVNGAMWNRLKIDQKEAVAITLGVHLAYERGDRIPIVNIVDDRSGVRIGELRQGSYKTIE